MRKNKEGAAKMNIICTLSQKKIAIEKKKGKKEKKEKSKEKRK